MFTGIIERMGEVSAVQPVEQGDVRISIDCDKLDLSNMRMGDSIAINGVCLTVIALEGNRFSADVSGETLSCTTFSELAAGSPVNLEQAMLASTRLGGHIVSGHVDGVAEVVALEEQARSVCLSIQVPDHLAKYIAVKGSVCVDGVSLTVNKVAGSVFTVNIIPHTLEETIIGKYTVGHSVNIEVDIIARYLERLLECRFGNDEKTSVDDYSFLIEHGYINKP